MTSDLPHGMTRSYLDKPPATDRVPERTTSPLRYTALCPACTAERIVARL